MKSSTRLGFPVTRNPRPASDSLGRFIDRALEVVLPRLWIRPAGFVVFALASFFVTAGAIPTASAQSNPVRRESPLAAKVRALNNNLLALQAEMQDGRSSDAAAIRNQAATVIAQRAAALATLIKQDPRTALTFAFSPRLLADVGTIFPKSAPLLESHITVTGPIQHWVEDGANFKTSRSYFRMQVGGRILNLYFGGSQPNLNSGITFDVTGVTVGNDMAVSKISSASNLGATGPLRQQGPQGPTTGVLLLLGACVLGAALRINRLLALTSLRKWAVCAIAFALLAVSPSTGLAQTTTCSTTGAQNVAVLLVTFPGDTPPTWLTTQYVYQMFFGATDPSLNRYWTQASYGQTSAAGNVFGWFTLSGSYSCSSITGLITDSVNAAIASGVNIQAYDRVFIIFPDMSPSCGWAGLSSIGCYNLTTASGTLTASTTVLVWNYLTPLNQGVGIIAHEGGHQLGLAHARLREFGTEPLGPLGATGTLYEYGDHFSAMGFTNLGEYAAGHKADILNWLASGTNYQVVQSSGTYTLEPYETNPAGLVALKVQRGTGNSAWLWVEYRQPIGYYDSTLPTQPFSGALIHYEDSVTSPQTDLLDFTAPSTYSNDPALVPGQTWTDPYSNVSISVLSATSTGLTVTVNYGAELCTTSPPSVNLSPADPSIYAGQSAAFDVSVTDNDSPACSSNTFNLASADPTGWSSSLSAPSITLSPGQSGSVTLSEGAPLSAAPGTFAVAVTATSGSYSGSGSANATVIASSLAASLAVSGISFTTPTTVSMSVSVTYNGSPASGAGATFTLTSPTGGTTTNNATTNSSGVATWNYKLNSRAPAGTYSVVAQAAVSSGSGSGGGKKKNLLSSAQTATSNTVSFNVR